MSPVRLWERKKRVGKDWDDRVRCVEMYLIIVGICNACLFGNVPVQQYLQSIPVTSGNGSGKGGLVLLIGSGEE